jgi:hypothetical protein
MPRFHPKLFQASHLAQVERIPHGRLALRSLFWPLNHTMNCWTSIALYVQTTTTGPPTLELIVTAVWILKEFTAAQGWYFTIWPIRWKQRRRIHSWFGRFHCKQFSLDDGEETFAATNSDGKFSGFSLYFASPDDEFCYGYVSDVSLQHEFCFPVPRRSYTNSNSGLKGSILEQFSAITVTMSRTIFNMTI